MSSKKTVNAEKNVETIGKDSISFEQACIALKEHDAMTYAEKREYLDLCVVKGCNVLAHEKKADRLNRGFGLLSQMYDKSIFKTFVHCLTVLSSAWEKTENGKAMQTCPASQLIQITQDNKIKLITCVDYDKFSEMWQNHVKFIAMLKTDVLSYCDGVKIGKTVQETTWKSCLDKIEKMYKTADTEGKKKIASILRENGRNVPA